MSGHSHWATIKRTKEVEDRKRGKIFSKVSRLITLAVKEKGGDPDTNYKLRLAIEQAKSVNMPKDNIDRAIQRGLGKVEGENLEEFIFEVFGPGGIAIIIEGITDNKNRSLLEVKKILNQYNGKLANEGSVRWLFERKGVININKDEQEIDKEELELKVIEAGAEDFSWKDNFLEVYTSSQDLEKVKKELENMGIKIESASFDFVPKETVEVKESDKETIEKLFEDLDENDSVQNIYTNVKF
ncbi:MAG TPA: YebC/PmpR family DNA-binding transcriptional regulator [Candidatus Pacearchaeota archaeon]|jgi:YebC/PmpR family DNA-binding regulatory protein|nr:YebC/PmpR family DNA-binding transcriptional regulator [Candidatus Pacearchaeota archaeon]